MTNRFVITCYLGWCGAEASFKFNSKESYEAARTFLDGIALGHLTGERLPSGYSATMDDYYVLEARDREAFQDFMARSSA
jgi:hypothetical protein